MSRTPVHSNTPQNSPLQRVTRLAPSPTGALHFGNARTFLLNWALARKLHWRIILRIEDLDTPRTKPGADKQAIHDLAWLGIDWDEGPYYQSQNLRPYQDALAYLIESGRAFACQCTRREIEQALSAPHANSHELRYPGTCRLNPTQQANHESATWCWRLKVHPGYVHFEDQIKGEQQIDVDQETGDFVIWTKMGLPAYQLAVVMDDAKQQVTDVVRGDDLLSSTARQLLLYEALNYTPPCFWWHLPLVIGPDGHRLAKRHGDTRIAWYREQAVSTQRLIGLIAYTCGMSDKPTSLSLQDFIHQLDLAKLQKQNLQPIIFTSEMHQWLLSR